MSIGTRIKEARRAAKMTQKELAAKVGVKQATISELETGESSGTTLIASFASALNVNALWLETGKGSPSTLSQKSLTDFTSNITVTHPDDDPDPNIVYIKVSDVKFSAGNGNIAHYEILEDSGPAGYQLSWFAKEGMRPENTKRFRVKGDSMEPFLYNNDTILVNFDEVNIVEGKLYAIRYGDELRVKYIHRLLNGSIILRSVNSFYKDEEITPELANEHITIIGRVRDKSGRGGL